MFHSLVSNALKFAGMLLLSDSLFSIIEQVQGEKCDGSIYEIACSGRDDLAEFCDLIETLGHEDALSTDSIDVTFFIPKTGINDLMESSGEEIPGNYLYRYHYVTRQSLMFADLNCGVGNDSLVTMANDKDSRTKCVNDVPIYQKGSGNSNDNMPQFEEVDIEACNGIIHIISEPMIPPPQSHHDDGSDDDSTVEEHNSAVSAHCLDTTRGKPGAGIKVTLEYQQDDGSFVVVGENVTDEDGRANSLYPSDTLEAGIYRITFYSKSYYDNLGEESFYDSIPVVFIVNDEQTTEHFHLPLLLSNFAYSTYRGS